MGEYNIYDFINNHYHKTLKDYNSLGIISL